MLPPLCSTVRFGRHLIAYDDRVLEPRPWTLLQSDWATQLSDALPDGPILELCSGAGQIGLAAAAPSGRRLVQVDLNPVACQFARDNAARAGLGDRVEVRCSDLADAAAPGETFPLVIADPPYLPRASVARYPDDPVLTVDGGEDGMQLLRACMAVIDAALAPDGLALVQLHGARQAAALAPSMPRSLELGEVREHDPERAVVLVARRPNPTPTGGDA